MTINYAANHIFYYDICELYPIFDNTFRYDFMMIGDFIEAIYPYEIKTYKKYIVQGFYALATEVYTEKTKANILTYLWIMRDFHKNWVAIYDL